MRERINWYTPAPTVPLALVLRRVHQLEVAALAEGDEWAAGEAYSLALTLSRDAAGRGN